MSFKYDWLLSDGYPAKGIEKHESKVFSCFACGGGSSMGYKLAGYSMIGINEIDEQMIRIYQKNHVIDNVYHEPIQDFKGRDDLPKELFDLDILDGSPPCSTFSMAGNREKDWDKEKMFREGQAEQVLSDLFFDFIDLAEKLQPKIVVAENVKGMLAGNAKGYCMEIRKRFEEIGYDVQLFCLNASTMGVPQKRERVFFMCRRRDLNLPELTLDFNERPIPFKEIDVGFGKELTDSFKRWWYKTPKGRSFSDAHPNGSYFNISKVHPDKVMTTIIANSVGQTHYLKPCNVSDKSFCLAGSYPIDYDFLDAKVKYVVGMSVPPVMIAQVANEVYKQWLKK